MRSSKNRSRSKGNRNRSVGNIVNRVFDSSGPEGKVRGTPQQIIDKYNQLARDAQLGNDRVAAENFQQHAEHYTRMLSEAQREMEAKREQQQQQNQNQQNQQGGGNQRRDRNGGGGSQDEAQQPQPAPQTAEEAQGKPVEPSEPPASQPAEADAPGAFDAVIEPAAGDSGLVETPESAPKPKRPRRRRKPAEGDGDKGDQPSQEAAE